jgi:hypothetical protein
VLLLFELKRLQVLARMLAVRTLLVRTLVRMFVLMPIEISRLGLERKTLADDKIIFTCYFTVHEVCRYEYVWPLQ